MLVYFDVMGGRDDEGCGEDAVVILPKIVTNHVASRGGFKLRNHEKTSLQYCSNNECHRCVFVCLFVIRWSH